MIGPGLAEKDGAYAFFSCCCLCDSVVLSGAHADGRESGVQSLEHLGWCVPTHSWGVLSWKCSGSGVMLG